MYEINKDRLAEFEKAHLFPGCHKEGACEKCDQEWLSYLMNAPHGYHPPGVCPVINSFRVSLNDNWPDSERDRLKATTLRCIGTASTPEVETKRAIAALDWSMRVHRPLWVEAAGLGEYAAKMRALPEIVDEASFRVAAKLQDEAIREARAAWEAWAAWEARAAIGGLVTFRAIDSLGAKSSEAERREAGIAALSAVAAKVRDAAPEAA